jgi:hypothetical protein
MDPRARNRVDTEKTKKPAVVSLKTPSVTPPVATVEIPERYPGMYRSHIYAW